MRQQKSRFSAAQAKKKAHRHAVGLGDSANLKLLKEKPYSGENSFGAYYLHSMSHEGVEKAFFTNPDLHRKIAEAGLKTGDEFRIKKVGVQNGRKVTARVDFDVISKAVPSATPPRKRG